MLASKVPDEDVHLHFVSGISTLFAPMLARAQKEASIASATCTHLQIVYTHTHTHTPGIFELEK